LDLLLKLWGKEAWVKWIVKKVKAIFFIWEHHAPLENVVELVRLVISKVVLVATSIYHIWWQTTHHGEGMACHENIRMICFIIMKSTIFIIIKPWRCNGRSILPLMEDVDSQFTLCRGFFQSILIGWSLLPWWCIYEKNVKLCVTKNTHNSTTYTQALKDFVDFVENWKSFSNTPPTNNFNFFPHEWWDLIGANVHTFAPIACQILAQVCLTSSCKLSWNLYSFVHSKVQNRLTMKHVEDLVYIYTNKKFLWEWLGANPIAWYEKNMLFKD
jgi:hypothetical protein